VKLLADPLFPVLVVKKLKRAGHDAVHSVEIGAGDLPLLEILKLATLEHRVVLTRNQRLTRYVESKPGEWPSVVLLKVRGDADSISRLLIKLLALFDEDLASGAVVIVSEGQTLLRKFIQRPDA
jgi:predicted nuclease of predicted toxin-antitoxin system